MGHMKHVAYGAIAGAALLAVYFVLLTLLNSLQHAVERFIIFWPWMAALVAGLGIQVGLFSCVRDAAKARAGKGNAVGAGTTAGVAATGGVSGTSMVLCCLHHATEVLPLIGLSAAALFVSQYQTPFFVVGIASNAVGIAVMLDLIQKNGLSKWLEGGIDMGMVKKAVAAVAAAAIVLSFYFTAASLGMLGGTAGSGIVTGAGISASTGTSNSGSVAAGAGTLSLATLNNSESGMSVDVTPVDFGFGKEVEFEVRLTTHSGSLDFEVDKIAVLQDSTGKTYTALGWDGSTPGGHHSSGTLSFPAIDSGATSMTLVLRNVAGVAERKFTWQLA